jgi:hypothetical protein
MEGEIGSYRISFTETNHPIWHFRSSNISSADWDGDEEKIRYAAQSFLKTNLSPHLHEGMKQMVKNNGFSLESKDNQEVKRLFVMWMRPFFYPFYELSHWLWKLKFHGYKNQELEWILNWRLDSVIPDSEAFPFLLRQFCSDARACLYSMPEVILIMYSPTSIKSDFPDSLAALALKKIRQIHPEDDPLRLRVEAINAVWMEEWDAFIRTYSKIPAEWHDWDPVPRYFLPIALHERMENEKAIEQALGEIDYYGGIPKYLHHCIHGCREFSKGNFEKALAEKIKAYNTNVNQAIIAIQLGVILNKLERYEATLDYLNPRILYEIHEYENGKETNLDAAMTEVCLALEKSGKESRRKDFENEIIGFKNVAITRAYEKARANQKTSVSSQASIVF